jgi:hypothetical protein
MPAEQFHLAHRREGCFQALDRFQRANPSEVSRANRGKEIEPNIRGRSSVGDNGFGCFLKIVWRERVVLMGNKSRKEVPSPAAMSRKACSSASDKRLALGE